MRYTGPKWRINRRENATVLGSSEKWKKRPTLPGQFPVLKKRPSDYAIQFREKQKVKRIYGMTEKQFRRFYKIASKSAGNTSTRLLQLLELRADNVVYQLGLAQTRTQARQFVTHGHITLNGKKHNIPSTVLKSGDEIQLTEKFAKSPIVAEISSQTKTQKIPSWLKKGSKGGTVVAEPTRDEMDQSIKERLIIELYSR
ncbi:30S ribosomal protein S4 [Candidatus Dojkabacteria bacterium]|uniref:Small ribosomal subunit protein uS4 n=1 Tax=Candidatus Dojkabacteria bacterium TaxID=2099670 RepID=A0A955IA77_9BACT|nr:30S ribosomal protein S4 [Candidatus Dojkabacteria bacterium]